MLTKINRKHRFTDQSSVLDIFLGSSSDKDADLKKWEKVDNMNFYGVSEVSVYQHIFL